MTKARREVVRAETVFALDGSISPGEVVVEAGRISEVRAATGPAPERILAPGFVDLQVNGIGGADVARASDEDWDRLGAALLAQGTTTWCPSLLSAPLDDLVGALEGVARAAGRAGPGQPAIAGAHLEGPFLSLPGAHRPDHLVGTVDSKWLAALPDIVAVVTLAPELPGALDAVAALTGSGVVVALGHSSCTAEQAVAAADAGARLVTHLGNAMGPFHQRRPGLMGAALADERLSVTVIADLVHLHPAWLALAFACKGPEGVALVTDTVAVGAEAPVGKGPGPALEAGSGAPRLADGTLAGSALSMNEAVGNCATAAHSGLAAALSAASTTPARLLGLTDRGAIAPGRRADLVALGPDLAVEAVWLGGTPADASGADRRWR